MAKNDIIRQAEDALDPVGAPARRVLNGEWSPDPREVLREADQMERLERQLAWAEADVKKDASASRRIARLAELASIRAKLRSSTDGHIYRAGSLLDGRANERLSDDDWAAFRRAVNSAVADTSLDRSLAQLEDREREQVKITREPGAYEKGSPASWVADVLVSADPELRGMAAGRSGESDMRPTAVSERLSRHAKDVARALVRGDGYGKTIEATLREQNRREDADAHRTVYRKQLRELRSGLVTGGGLTASASGGFAAAFVPPAFLMEQWAAYRSPYRAFADQCDTSVALPSYGLTVYLPQVSGATSVTTETELAGVSEADPTTALLSSPIVLKAGQVVVSQQFLDRVGPGIAGDAVLFTQLKEQLSAQVDSFALSQALANAQSVTDSSAFALTTATGVGGVLGDLKHAKSKLTDTAGVRLRGTHAFATGDFVDYIGSYADSGGRPMFSPHYDDNYLPIRAGSDNDSGGAEGYSGYVLVGLALFADDNIPNSGSNTQIVVCKPSTILHMEAAPVPYVYPPSYAGSLDAVLGVRQYIATLPKYPSGVAVISGTAYATSTFA